MDNSIDSTDATLVLQHYANIIMLSDNASIYCDVNKDNSIDSTDATLILQYYANIINSFAE